MHVEGPGMGVFRKIYTKKYASEEIERAQMSTFLQQTSEFVMIYYYYHLFRHNEIHFAFRLLTGISLQPWNHASIQSPNYQFYYFNNINIRWFVSVPSSYQVRVNFTSFSTEENYDFVYVSDGWTSDYSNSTRVASLSGYLSPDDVISRGSYLWIEFTSDDLNRYYTGFQARLTPFRTISLQFWNVTSIQSPNYPRFYYNNINIRWFVSVPPAYQVRLNFTQFSTDKDHDFVNVRDGWTSNYTSSTQLASLSGYSTPDDIISNGSHIWVQFTSDEQIRRAGFRANLISELRAISLQPWNVTSIQSPNTHHYPYFYYNNTNIRWFVSVPPVYRVRLNFTRFSTQKDNDFVIVRDGWTSNYSNSTRVASLSGDLNPDDIISRGSYLWVTFTSDDWATSTGFEAQLTPFRNISLQPWNHASIQSPNYPYSYYNNINIRWFVSVPSSYQVRVNFTSFSTEENHDFVYVRDGWTSDYSNSTRVASLSGYLSPDDVISRGSYLWIDFTSDDGNRYNTGFQARLTPFRTISLQPWNVTSIQSPNRHHYPYFYYNNINIRWFVSVPPAYQVRLNFTQFSTDKDHDFVYVRDGWTSNYTSSTQLASLSGYSRPDDIISNGSYIWVQFTSDEQNSRAGFRANLIFELRSIHLKVGKVAVIQSPNHPHLYYNDLNIRWFVSVPPAYQVRLHFNNFSTEVDRDFVIVNDGWTSNYTSSALRGRLSGSINRGDIVSNGSHLWVQFTTTDRGRSEGFRALLTTELRSIHLQYGESGSIESPNYPNNYYNNLNVTWLVIVPPAYQMRLHFVSFSTEKGPDFVTVNDGWTSDYSSSTERRNLSGSIDPGDIVSNGSYFWVQFTTNNQGRSEGFRALLTTELRSLHLKDGKSRTIESPNYPNHYYNNLNVTWLVNVPPAYKVRLHFSSFETELNKDFVKVRDGWTSDYSSSTQLASLSGDSSPDDIISRGSYLWVYFTSDGERNFSGFTVNITTELRSIQLNTTGEAVVTSPDSPVNGDYIINVTWFVVASPPYRVGINFSDFSRLENGDLVTLREGWTSNYSRSTLRGSLSASSISTDMTSIGSYLWIQFTTLPQNKITGFRASLFAVIPIISVDAAKAVSLQSPNYPAQYPNNIDLMWQVIAPENHQVSMHFVDFQLEPSKDFLHLFQGQSSEFEMSELVTPNISRSDLPENIKPIGAYLWIRFTSDEASRGIYRGFKISLIAKSIPERLTSDTGNNATTILSVLVTLLLSIIVISIYIIWKKRLAARKSSTQPRTSHEEHNDRGNVQESRPVNRQPLTPDLLASHQPLPSNAYMTPETILPTHDLVSNEYQEYGGRNHPDYGMPASGNMDSRDTDVYHPHSPPHYSRAMKQAEVSGNDEYHEYGEIDEAMPYRDGGIPSNASYCNNPYTSSDDVTYFTFESPVAEADDNSSDHQGIEETSFNEASVAESNSTELKVSGRPLRFQMRSSKAMNDKSEARGLGKESFNHYQNAELAANFDTKVQNLRRNSQTNDMNEVRGADETETGNAKLHDEKEYDSLNYRQPSYSKSRVCSKPIQESYEQTEGVAEKNVYGVLELPKSSHVVDKGKDILHNDNVYGTLTTTGSDVDCQKPEGGITTKPSVHMAFSEDKSRKNRKTKSKSDHQAFGNTGRVSSTITGNGQRGNKGYDGRASSNVLTKPNKSLKPPRKLGKEGTTHGNMKKVHTDKQDEDKSIPQIHKTEGLYENGSFHEEHPVYQNSVCSEAKDSHIDHVSVNEDAYAVVGPRDKKMLDAENYDSVYSNLNY
ncbi:cubilin-like [Lytechinus pictus]|uniref:cubilin-like n=1 Tax=Lytechinus pictus TaxID=7653 RepID=UPI0030BA11C1